MNSKQALLGFLVILSNPLLANDCKELPGNISLKTQLNIARKASNGGIDLDLWGTVVNRFGYICAVAYTGSDSVAQWPGSRLISAEKANTANSFSLTNLAISTANLYSVTQPGGFLFGLQESNPLNVVVAYKGPLNLYGTNIDPLVGKKIGGIVAYGGGLALYNPEGKLIGAIGVSGDTPCADHNIAWKVRHGLNLDHVPAGLVGGANKDNIIFDIDNAGKSASGWGHPLCLPADETMNENVLSEAPLPK